MSEYQRLVAGLSALDNVPYLVAYVDCRRRYRYVNRIYAETFGLVSDSVVGRRVQDVLPEDFYRKAEPLLEKAFDGESQEFELRVLLPNELWSHFKASYTPDAADDGTIRGVTIMASDETSRKEAQQELLRGEQQFRAFMDNLPAVAFIKDKDGRYLFGNRAAYTCAGCTLEEFVGSTVFDVFPQELAVKLHEKDTKAFEGDERGVLNEFSAFIDGEERWLEDRKFPIELADGERVLGAFAFDVTERRRASEKLIQSEQIYRELFENISNGVAIYETADDGQQFYFKDINPEGERICQISREELVGREATSVLPGLEKMGIIELLRKVWRTGESGVLETSQYVDDKLELWVENYVFKLPAGEIVAVFEDVTERQRFAQRLAQAEKLEAIGTLSSGIAHDFNNILGAIIGNTELGLRSEGMSQRQEFLWNGALEAAIRGRDLVKQILTFGRGSSPHREDVVFGQVLEEALRLLRTMLPSSIQIVRDVDPHIGSLFADPSELYQVVTNLCVNATQAMADSGGTLSVSLQDRNVDATDTALGETLAPGRYLCLTVADTGTGMDATTRERLFDPFFTTKTSGCGTGLGMAVVHGIVKGLNGAIIVESALGKGSDFHVYLPAAETATVDSCGTPDKEPVRGEGQHIMVVEDEASLQNVMTRQLQYLGYTSECFRSPLTALECFKNDPTGFDLVLSDQNMPLMNGTELVAKLKEIRPTTPVLMMTGYRDTQTYEAALELGVLEIVSKPVSLDELADLIQDALNS